MQTALAITFASLRSAIPLDGEIIRRLLPHTLRRDSVGPSPLEPMARFIHIVSRCT